MNQFHAVAPTGQKSAGRIGRIAPILLLLLIYAFFGQGMRGLWKPDEGRYTCVALNMLDRGDWIFPQLNDEKPHFTKPPLTYWAIASSIALFGRNEWAARIPSALAFFGTVLLIAAMGPRLSPRKPRLAALIYASFPLVYVAANLVTTDTLLTFWETLAMFGFVEWWHRREDPGRCLWALLMWAAFGLAFLTKGPPGLLPLLPVIAFTATRGDARALKTMCAPRGLLLFALIGSFWYVVVCASNPRLFGYFVGDEVYGRIVTGMHNRNAEWYGAVIVYIPALLAGALPWNLILLRNLHSLWGRRPRPPFTPDDPLADSGRLLAFWFLIPLAVFFIARSRLPLYLIPLFVPLSLILARQFDGIDLARGWRRYAIGSWIVILAASRIVGDAVPTDKNSNALATAIRRSIQSTPREIVFVDKTADYGLKFYLDAEVEDVQTGKIPGIESLAEEISDAESGQLFLVSGKKEGKLLKTPPPVGTKWLRLGKYKDTLFYAYDAALKPSPGKRLAL